MIQYFEHEYDVLNKNNELFEKYLKDKQEFENEKKQFKVHLQNLVGKVLNFFL